MLRIKILLFLIIIGYIVKAQDNQDSNTININSVWVQSRFIFSDTPLTQVEQKSIEKDDRIISEIPENYEVMSLDDLKYLNSKLDTLINTLKNEKDDLLINHCNSRSIRSKNKVLTYLIKDKQIIELTQSKIKLSGEQGLLLTEKQKLRSYLITAGICFILLILLTLILLQRSRIRSKNVEIFNQLQIVNKKNAYLEYAAKIIRHDMHSGINTYIPRGISSLERKLNSETISNLKLEGPLKILKEGLLHTQKVYKGVYEFTNLVKKDATLEKELCNLKKVLVDYLSNTTYISQVHIQDLDNVEINQSLFCTAIDNLIRNGLKYNDSDTKKIDIYMEEDYVIIQDNGRGMTQEEFDIYSKPYIRKEEQKETGSGLGLNICVAILQEHNFHIYCEKNEIGTKIKIKIRNND